MDRKREHLWPFLLVGGAAVAGLVLLIAREAGDAGVRIRFEQQALDRLRLVAAAEQALHEKTGRYGWAPALAAEGLIESAWVLEDGSIACPRYRIDVLLPHGLSPREFVQLAPRGSAKANPRLEARYVAVVARPWGEQRTGMRSFCIDERGRLYISEGVAATSGGLAPPLPEFHFADRGLIDTGGRRWLLAEDPAQP